MSDYTWAMVLVAAGSAIVGLLTYRHSGHSKGFTMFGRYIGSGKMLRDYDEENNFVDKYSR